MNYEKKYKEALEKASKLRVQNPFDTVGQMVEHIFPELKESEGERIRKEIMDFIDTNTIESDERRNRWFSYLEKYKPISFTSLDDTKVKMSLMQYISGLNKDVVRLHPGIETCNEWLSWLEKQGEMSKMCPTSVQDEQKPADKVEPKFKVKYAGSEYNVLEIKESAGVTYYGIEDEPNHIDYVKAENCEIISGYAIKENGSPYPTKPAVFSEKKPQRMVSAEAKEALYDKPTDEEMKELLRTEYEKGRADTLSEMKSSWSEEDINKPNGGIVMEDFNDGNGFYKVNLAYLNEEQVKEIEELVKRWDCQPKENEDESIISDLLDYFEEDKCLKHEVNDVVKWLKTIKPQPNQKWSEEDEKILNNLIDYIKVDDALQYPEKQVVNWLKSLKQRIGG